MKHIYKKLWNKQTGNSKNKEIWPILAYVATAISIMEKYIFINASI